MKRLTVAGVAIIALLAGFGAYSAAGSRQSREAEGGPGVRVGTFDSRAVALAYYRSDEFRSQMAGLKAEYEKAKAAGDEKRIQELDAEGPAQQELAHKQGFSTWPVDDILKKIEERIPGIAQQAGVDLIVSKWDLVYERSDAEFVDVTDLMVQPFAPDEKTLEIIQQLKTRKPVPLAQLESHRD